MMFRSNTNAITSNASFVRGASAAVILVGVAVLVGWLLDIVTLKSSLPGLATMKPNTALAFCFAGLSLWLRASSKDRSRRLARGIAQAAAALLVLIGLLTLGEYALGWDLGIDQMLFRDLASVTGAPGRMSPITAGNVMLIGLALLLLDTETRRGRRPAEWLALIVAATALITLFGYIYEVQALYRIAAYTSVALHTALTFVILCLAVLLARPRTGMMAVVTSDSAGGRLARRLLPATIILPVVLGTLRLVGQKAGLYPDQFGDALVAVAISATLAALIWSSARALDRSEAKLRHANRALKTLSDSNSALVHAASEAELLDAACRAIVASGGYRMAWVGYADDGGTKTVRPVAQAGIEDGYLDSLQITWDDGARGRGPTGMAIRSGRAVIANDILHDPAFLPWRARALARGYTSSIALPLLAGGQTLGALNIYSAEPDAFDATETRLLDQLANDLAYGITALRTREAGERAEAQLSAHAARLKILADSSHAFAEVGADYQMLLDQVAHTTADVLGAGCRIHVLSEDGVWLRRAALYDSDPAKFDLMRTAMGDAPIRVDEPTLTTRIFQTSQPLLIPFAEPSQLSATTKPEYRSLPDQLGSHSLLGVPMRVQGRTIGVLSLYRHSHEQPPFDEDDLTLAQDLAARATLAISNARLLEQVQQSNVSLEQRVAERTAEIASANADLQAEIAERTRLEQHIRQDTARANARADLSQALAETRLDYQSLFATIARRIAELVGDTCIMTLLSEDEQWLQTVAVYHPDPDGLAFIRALMASEPYRANEGLAGRVVEMGKALLMSVVPQAQIRSQIKPEYASYLDRFGMSSLLIVPLRARGRVLGTLGVSRDQPGRPYTVDDQTLLQDLADRAGLSLENVQLFAEVQQARAAAEHASQAKTNFLRATSHELRTPLNAIIGFTGMLLMQLPGPLTDDQEKQLQTIQSSAKHLLALINDLLDLSRIEAGKVELSFERVVCQEILAEVASNLRPLAEQKGLTLEIESPEQEVVVKTDRRALSQILINLTNNAIKFTSRGRVTITTSQWSTHGSIRTEISVADTGAGIRSEDQRHLFEVFARSDDPAARMNEGSGLGLHLSQQLAGLLGGRITCESEYGVGSRFSLMLEVRS
jgi:signal transduction histidine kinase